MRYDTYSTVARSCASLRSECWSTAQLIILDMTIARICDDLAEMSPRFSPDLFLKLAKYGHNRP